MVTVIFFDAVGTLFGVEGGVGQMYHQVAQEFGVAVDVARIDRCFIEVFRSAPPMAFPGCPLEAIYQKEYQWWYDLAVQTFTRSGDYGRFSNFDRFFARLYEFFASVAPWEVYSDVPVSLAKLRSEGYRLGIISNFDSRIFTVLEKLELSHFFDGVIISTHTGVAKPDRGIFTYALEQFQVRSGEALHVGDSLKEDYEGAKNAGMAAFWLQRPHQSLLHLLDSYQAGHQGTIG